MQASYLVSVSSLKQILRSAATSGERFAVVTGRETVTIVQYTAFGVLHQVSFPVAYRIDDVPDDEGTMTLMIATERGRAWNSFWVPVEAHVTHCSTNALA